MRHIVSQLMPCTKIFIRHYDPSRLDHRRRCRIRAAKRRDGNYSMQRAIDRDRL